MLGSMIETNHNQTGKLDGHLPEARVGARLPTEVTCALRQVLTDANMGNFSDGFATNVVAELQRFCEYLALKYGINTNPDSERAAFNQLVTCAAPAVDSLVNSLVAALFKDPVVNTREYLLQRFADGGEQGILQVENASSRLRTFFGLANDQGWHKVAIDTIRNPLVARYVDWSVVPPFVEFEASLSASNKSPATIHRSRQLIRTFLTSLTKHRGAEIDVAAEKAAWEHSKGGKAGKPPKQVTSDGKRVATITEILCCGLGQEFERQLKERQAEHGGTKNMLRATVNNLAKVIAQKISPKVAESVLKNLGISLRLPSLSFPIIASFAAYSCPDNAGTAQSYAGLVRGFLEWIAARQKIRINLASETEAFERWKENPRSRLDPTLSATAALLKNSAGLLGEYHAALPMLRKKAQDADARHHRSVTTLFCDWVVQGKRGKVKICTARVDRPKVSKRIRPRAASAKNLKVRVVVRPTPLLTKPILISAAPKVLPSSAQKKGENKASTLTVAPTKQPTPASLAAIVAAKKAASWIDRSKGRPRLLTIDGLMLAQEGIIEALVRDSLLELQLLWELRVGHLAGKQGGAVTIKALSNERVMLSAEVDALLRRQAENVLSSPFCEKWALAKDPFLFLAPDGGQLFVGRLEAADWDTTPKLFVYQLKVMTQLLRLKLPADVKPVKIAHLRELDLKHLSSDRKQLTLEYDSGASELLVLTPELSRTLKFHMQLLRTTNLAALWESPNDLRYLFMGPTGSQL